MAETKSDHILPIFTEGSNVEKYQKFHEAGKWSFTAYVYFFPLLFIFYYSLCENVTFHIHFYPWKWHFSFQLRKRWWQLHFHSLEQKTNFPKTIFNLLLLPRAKNGISKHSLQLTSTPQSKKKNFPNSFIKITQNDNKTKLTIMLSLFFPLHS